MRTQDDLKNCGGCGIECGPGQECVNNRCQLPQSTGPAEQPTSSGACTLDTVYFAFDSATLESSARDAIAKNAQCARERGITSVKITGFTDPRGTEEYNLALGDRRARSVEQYMNSLGVDKKSLSTASMCLRSVRNMITWSSRRIIVS